MSATGDDDDDGCYSIALIGKILSQQQLDELIQILQFVMQHDCKHSVSSKTVSFQ